MLYRVLELYRKGYKSSYKGYVSLFLNLYFSPWVSHIVKETYTKVILYIRNMDDPQCLYFKCNYIILIKIINIKYF